MKPKRKYWIHYEIYECPVCGRGGEYRERIYDRPKPKTTNKRYNFHDSYDGCLEYSACMWREKP